MEDVVRFVRTSVCAPTYASQPAWICVPAAIVTELLTVDELAADARPTLTRPPPELAEIALESPKPWEVTSTFQAAVMTALFDTVVVAVTADEAVEVAVETLIAPPPPPVAAAVTTPSPPVAEKDALPMPTSVWVPAPG